jgi:hypothetical protein
MDFDSSNHIAHHNVVWSTQNSIRMNSASTNNKVYNNTFASGGGGRGLETSPGRDRTMQMPGAELKNNIFSFPLNPLVNGSGAVQQNNTLPPADPQFVDPSKGNYQLKATSPSIDAGAQIPPYTDGFTGRAPDAGAYESGVAAWKAGAGQSVATIEPNGSSMLWLSAGSVALATLGVPPAATGTKVTVTDGAGVERAAQVTSVVTNRVTFVIPNDTAAGVAMVTVTSGDGAVSIGSAPIF